MTDTTIMPKSITPTSITLANGRVISFDIRQDGAGPPCFLLSVRKCGSTIANKICRALAAANDRCFVEVGHTFFANNVIWKIWSRDPALRQIIRPGVIYGGFRDPPLTWFGVPAFVAAPKLMLVRDPRDALVSEYFSNAYSHTVPPPSGESDDVAKLILTQRALALSESIEAYVLRRAEPMGLAFTRYAPILSMPNLLVLKYEDVILRKPELIAQLARHFGMSAAPHQVAAILKWADVLPASEDPRAFVRQVRPGDHARKLDAATIANLNKILADAMQLFGYDPEQRTNN